MCAHSSVKSAFYGNGFVLYTIVISLGILSGILNFEGLNNIAVMMSDAFIKIFKCLSLPLISLSMIVTITSYHSDMQMKRISQKTLCYTLVTTVTAAIVACMLYALINPTTPQMISLRDDIPPIRDISYLQHISQLIPSHIF